MAAPLALRGDLLVGWRTAVGGAALLLCLSPWLGACSRPPLAAGERLRRSKCSACHVPPEPRRYDRSGWEDVLDLHRERVPLSAGQRALLLDHLAPNPSLPDR